MEAIIGSIIGFIVVLFLLNYLSTRHVFEVDLEKDMPFTKHWLFEMTQKERDDAWRKVVEESKKEWEHIYATMTDEEIEEKYKIATIRPMKGQL